MVLGDTMQRHDLSVWWLGNFSPPLTSPLPLANKSCWYHLNTQESSIHLISFASVLPFWCIVHCKDGLKVRIGFRSECRLPWWTFIYSLKLGRKCFIFAFDSFLSCLQVLSSLLSVVVWVTECFNTCCWTVKYIFHPPSFFFQSTLRKLAI